MKVGDIVRYGYSKNSDGTPVTGLVLRVNEGGGSLKVLDMFGNIDWFVTNFCVVINEQ